MAGKYARKSQKRLGPSRDINPAQATHLRDPDAEVCELGGDASLPSSACIAFPTLAPFHKTGTDLGGGNQLNFYTSLLRRFVPDLEVWYLNPKVSPTECICTKRWPHPPI